MGSHVHVYSIEELLCNNYNELLHIANIYIYIYIYILLNSNNIISLIYQICDVHKRIIIIIYHIMHALNKLHFLSSWIDIL